MFAHPISHLCEICIYFSLEGKIVAGLALYEQYKKYTIIKQRSNNSRKYILHVYLNKIHIAES